MVSSQTQRSVQLGSPGSGLSSHFGWGRGQVTQPCAKCVPGRVPGGSSETKVCVQSRRKCPQQKPERAEDRRWAELS